MKLLFLSLLFLSCAKKGHEAQVNGAIDDYQVQYLFNYKGCDVVRFKDAGNFKYFTNCNGSVSQTVSCGQHCSREESITTGVR